MSMRLPSRFALATHFASSGLWKGKYSVLSGTWAKSEKTPPMAPYPTIAEPLDDMVESHSLGVLAAGVAPA